MYVNYCNSDYRNYDSSSYCRENIRHRNTGTKCKRIGSMGMYIYRYITTSMLYGFEAL